MMVIKICGIRTIAEAKMAIAGGANALGFNFYPPSPRFIEPAAARAIMRHLPPGVLKVGVFVGTPTSRDTADLDVVQLHGLGSSEDLPDWDCRVWVATGPEGVKQFPTSEILIDSSWGRGEMADWDQVARVGRPYILSGGLNAENVARAIRRLRPAGVDVCSGVESSPGVKDPTRVARFLEVVNEELKADPTPSTESAK